MQYKFKNRVVLKILKKLIIVATNLLVSYLIIKINYIELLLTTKEIFISIKFEIFEKNKLHL